MLLFERGPACSSGPTNPETPEPGTDKKEKKDKESFQEVVPTKHEAIPEILIKGSRSSIVTSSRSLMMLSRM